MSKYDTAIGWMGLKYLHDDTQWVELDCIQQVVGRVSLGYEKLTHVHL